MENTAPVEKTTEEAPKTPPVEGQKAEEVKEKTAETKPEAKADPLSSRFATLSRKEKALRQFEQKLKDERAEIDQFKTLRAKAKEDPDAYLKAAGLDYDYLTNYLLNDKKPSEAIKFEKIGDEVKQLRQKLEEKEKAEAERAYQDKRNEAVSYIGKQAKQEPDKYPLCARDEEAPALALEVMAAYYAENGEELGVDQALSEVEKHLQDRVSKYIEIVREAPPFKDLFAPREAKTESEPATVTTAPKTLTNQPAVSSTKNVTFKSDAERMMAIANAFLK